MAPIPWLWSSTSIVIFDQESLDFFLFTHHWTDFSIGKWHTQIWRLAEMMGNKLEDQPWHTQRLLELVIFFVTGRVWNKHQKVESIGTSKTLQWPTNRYFWQDLCKNHQTKGFEMGWKSRKRLWTCNHVDSKETGDSNSHHDWSVRVPVDAKSSYGKISWKMFWECEEDGLYPRIYLQIFNF